VAKLLYHVSVTQQLRNFLGSGAAKEARKRPIGDRKAPNPLDVLGQPSNALFDLGAELTSTEISCDVGIDAD
jgi:hypothetical protein